MPTEAAFHIPASVLTNAFHHFHTHSFRPLTCLTIFLSHTMASIKPISRT